MRRNLFPHQLTYLSCSLSLSCCLAQSNGLVRRFARNWCPQLCEDRRNPEKCRFLQWDDELNQVRSVQVSTAKRLVRKPVAGFLQSKQVKLTVEVEGCHSIVSTITAWLVCLMCHSRATRVEGVSGRLRQRRWDRVARRVVICGRKWFFV